MGGRIAVSGPTGSGKTTLSRLLARRAGAALVAEPEPRELLSAFAREPRSACYALETSIMEGRRSNARGCAGAEWQIFDRTVGEDVAVFVALHHRRGFLDEQETARLVHLAREVEGEVGVPNVHVVLNADRDILFERFAASSPPQPVLDALDEQIELYRRWSEALVGVRLDIDTGARSLDEMEEAAHWIWRSL